MPLASGFSLKFKIQVLEIQDQYSNKEKKKGRDNYYLSIEGKQS